MSAIEPSTTWKPRKPVPFPWMYLGWAMLDALTLPASAAPVGVVGTIATYDLLENPPRILEQARFEVVLDGDRYAINVADENLTEQMVSDGRVSYKISDYALHMRHVPNPTAGPLLARVWYGPHVLTIRPFVGVLWLALTPYPSRIVQQAGPAPPWPAFWKFALKDAAAHALLWTNLVFMAGPVNQRLLRGMEWIWSVSALDTLPARNKEATLYYLDWDPKRLEIKKVRESLLRDRQDGVVEARYRVLQVTNYANLEWPLEFRFEILTHGEKVSMAWLGQIHEFKTAPPVLVPPPVSKPTQVDDHRFIDEALRLNELTYFITNTPWPGTNDPNLRRLFDEKRSRVLATQPRISPRWQLVFAVAVILLSVSTFPVLVLKRGRHADNTKRQQNKNKSTPA